MYLFLHTAVSIRATIIMIIIIKNATGSIISTGTKLNKDNGSVSVVTLSAAVHYQNY